MFSGYQRHLSKPGDNLLDGPKTAEKCFIPLTVGGGVRSSDDVRNLLLAGADKVSFNSAAVKNPNVISQAANRFGSQCIVCAIDAKAAPSGKWELFTHGGRKPTGIDAVEFARLIEKRCWRNITYVNGQRRDKIGLQFGYDPGNFNAVKIPVIASGGVGNLDHLVDGVIQGGASAVLAASIFHFGEYTIDQAKKHMDKAGIPVRLKK